ncbi:MAG TPA: hypothetical protein VNI54_11960 [Thermoanaerobaculia bacterium]|nr:hypothetical protein [Thermoanaerobaculia bacterium]
MNHDFSLNVTWDVGANRPQVSQTQQHVDVNQGEDVVITWVPTPAPGDTIEITSITGFPSAVSVAGPFADGTWTATYRQPDNAGRWSYIVSASLNGSPVVRHDPEIDNTPPPIPPG